MMVGKKTDTLNFASKEFVTIFPVFSQRFLLLNFLFKKLILLLNSGKNLTWMNDSFLSINQL